MEQTSKEEQFDYKKAFIVGLKTFVYCFIVLMFIVCSMFCLFPEKSLEMNEMFGFYKAKELNYQMIYAKTGKNADLYNVIVYEQQQKNYKKELKYLNIMLEKTDYNEFCQKLDEASLNSIEDKNLIPYSANVNAYFLSQKAICLYETNSDDCEVFIFKQTLKNDVSEISFSSYIDWIYNDETLTKEQKQELFNTLILTGGDSGLGYKTVLELLEQRITDLTDHIAVATESQKIIYTYNLMRIYRSRYFVYETLGTEDLKTENYNLYNNTKIQLNSLIDA